MSELTPQPAVMADEATSRSGERSKRARPQRMRPGSQTPAERGAQRVADVALGLAVAVAVLWGGGVEPVPMLVAGGCVLIAWFAHLLVVPMAAPPVSFAVLWLIPGVWVAAVHLMPLPSALVGQLFPEGRALIAAGYQALGLDPPGAMAIALSRGDAAMQAGQYLIAAAFGFVAARTWGASPRQAQIARLHYGLMTLGVVFAAISLTAMPTPLRHRIPGALRSMLGPFAMVNANHVAGALLAPLSSAISVFVFSGTTRAQTTAGFCGLFMGGTILLTASRGGIAAALLVVALNLLLKPGPRMNLRRDAVTKRNERLRRVGLQIATVVLVLLIAALPVLEQLVEETMSGEGKGLGKLAMMRQALPLLGAAPLVGMAPGSLQALLGARMADRHVRVDFIENLVLERLLDLGVVVGGLVVLGLVVSVARVWRRGVKPSPGDGLRVGVLAMVLQNLVDFSLEMGGPLLVFMSVAILASRAVRPRHEPDKTWLPARIHGPAVKALALVALVAGVTCVAWADGRMVRDAAPTLADTPTAEMPQVIAERFPAYDHAYYRYGRALDARDRFDEARLVLDHTLSLRPASDHARLFRLRAAVQTGQAEVAHADLAKLVDGSSKLATIAIGEVLAAEDRVALLAGTALAAPAYSGRIGAVLLKAAPSTLEDVVFAVRQANPDATLPIESALASAYLRRGLPDLADDISTRLLGNPATEDHGWYVVANLLRIDGEYERAVSLFTELCDRESGFSAACLDALGTLQRAGQPRQVLRFLRQRRSWFHRSPQLAHGYWAAVAKAQLELERPADAAYSARRSLAYDAASFGARLTLALALARSADHEGAAKIARDLAKERPDHAEVKALVASYASLERLRGLADDSRPGRQALPFGVTPTSPPDPTAQPVPTPLLLPLGP